VWVNAGSFRNGSFEYPGNPEHIPGNNLGWWNVLIGEPPPPPAATYPGCANSSPAWNTVFASGGAKAFVDWIDLFGGMQGFRHRGLTVDRGTEPAGQVLQTVTDLQPNADYVVSGWVELRGPAPGVTLPDGARLRVDGGGVVTAVEAARRTSGWERLSVRFRTGPTAGPVLVWLIAPRDPDPTQGPVYVGRFDDITLTKAP
jgi:hypothetical protein